MSLFLGEKRCHQGIHHSFRNAVTHGEQEHPPEQALERSPFTARGKGRSGSKRKRGRGEVHDKSGDHQLAIAEFVGNQRAEQDDDAETGKSTTGNGPEFRLCKAVLFGPLTEDAGPDRKSDTGCQNRHESRPEQALGIRGGGGILRHGGSLSRWSIGTSRGFDKSMSKGRSGRAGVVGLAWHAPDPDPGYGVSSTSSINRE